MLTSYQEPDKKARPGLEQRVGYVLKQAQQSLRSAMDDALRELGTTAAQYAALNVLAEYPGASGAELARRCFVTPQTMNDIVVGLEKAGMLMRKRHPVHGRILTSTLTPPGEELLTRADAAVSGIERQMLSQLNDRERATLLELLRRCVQSLDRGTLPGTSPEQPSGLQPDVVKSPRVLPQEQLRRGSPSRRPRSPLRA